MLKKIRGKPQSKNSAHSSIIHGLEKLYLGARQRGFRAAVQDLQRRIGTHSTELWGEGYMPDLWFFDEECMSVVLIEVEDTSKLSKEKLEAYSWLWSILDAYYWEVHLLAVSRWGAAAPIPLFYAAQPEEVKKNIAIFELSKIYCITDPEAREAARAGWMVKYPGYLRNNHYRSDRLERRFYNRGKRTINTAA